MTPPVRPARLSFHCTDHSGRSADATVDATFDVGMVRWIRHARVRCDTGAQLQLLGIAPSLDEVMSDVCAKVQTVVIDDDRPAGSMQPAKQRVLEGPFLYADGRPGRFRAERKSDGSIWSVEIVTDDGECFDSLEFPATPSALRQAATEDGALSVISELLCHHFGATV